LVVLNAFITGEMTVLNVIRKKLNFETHTDQMDFNRDRVIPQ
jgi:hypothetical protein